MILIGFIFVVVTLFSIEVQLRKGNKQNEVMIELLKDLIKKK
ncbi:hypothetical protein [Falsibacillus albus]|nr:hypothetical protein [Falsibacillus albus]